MLRFISQRRYEAGNGTERHFVLLQFFAGVVFRFSGLCPHPDLHHRPQSDHVKVREKVDQITSRFRRSLETNFKEEISKPISQQRRAYLRHRNERKEQPQERPQQQRPQQHLPHQQRPQQHQPQQQQRPHHHQPHQQ